MKSARCLYYLLVFLLVGLLMGCGTSDDDASPTDTLAPDTPTYTSQATITPSSTVEPPTVTPEPSIQPSIHFTSTAAQQSASTVVNSVTPRPTRTVPPASLTPTRVSATVTHSSPVSTDLGIISLTPSLASAAPAGEIWYVIPSIGVRIRACPQLDCATLALRNYRDPVTVVATSTDGWHTIALEDGRTGYLPMAWTSRTPPPPIVVATAPPVVVTIPITISPTVPVTVPPTFIPNASDTPGPPPTVSTTPPTILILPVRAPQGSVFTVTLTNFQPNEQVELRIEFLNAPAPLRSVTTTVDSAGNGTATFGTDSSYSLGGYRVRAFGQADSVAQATFEIE